MKPILISLVVAVALSSFNCSGSKNAAKSDKNTKTDQNNNTVANTNSSDKKLFRFTVSFISKGAGTDYQIRQKYDAFITDFETRNKVKIALSKAPWGREGEVDYCFDMNGINVEITEKFIAESKAILNSSDRINIGENTNCRGTIK